METIGRVSETRGRGGSGEGSWVFAQGPELLQYLQFKESTLKYSRIPNMI